MKFTILTLFPEMFVGPFAYSILKRAQEKKLLTINLVNIRDFSTDRHKTVDGRPYGGGRGMILRADVMDRAIQSAISHRPLVMSKKRVILLDPQGKTFNQNVAQRLAKYDHLIFVCGHYEGVDERIRKLVDEEISIGDYVLTGGEIPAMVMVDAVARLIPGVIVRQEATRIESFSPYAIRHTPYAVLEYPQYTRPPTYRKWAVPKILFSGNHAKIRKWRRQEATKRTKKRRPDLLTQKG